ncbi:MAG: DUF933 domain-containing protein [Candidatus Omnitrophica bacterium]|jgi:hypothetical protein|nr:DUF933 domain-containing protein [Candidatus Omnitrophota bacterium]
MKIFNFGLDISSGKYKYVDECFKKLVEKFSPDKSSPYTVEFIDSELDKADAVVFSRDKKVDFILIDLEKIEKRLSRSEDTNEKDLLGRAQKILEQEKLLYDGGFSKEEESKFRLWQLATIKPSAEKDKVIDITSLLGEVFEKSGTIFFFTCGKKEVKAWSLFKGDTALEAAGRIHSDLKRGFIKAEITHYQDIDNFFNMNEARSHGFVKLVDKDYIMQPNDIIEVKFNV